MKKDFIAIIMSISLIISGPGICVSAVESGSDFEIMHEDDVEETGVSQSEEADEDDEALLLGEVSSEAYDGTPDGLNGDSDIFEGRLLVYEDPEWMGTPAVIDDSLTTDDIEEMTGSRIGEEDVPLGEGDVLGGIVEGYDAPDDDIGSAWPAAYNETQEIDDYLSKHTPPTRDQKNEYGTCWAHATLAIAECYAINCQGMSPDIDLCERHLSYMTYAGQANSMGFDDGDSISITDSDGNPAGLCNGLELGIANKGGNPVYAAQSLARWRGAVSEDVAPYASLAEDSLDWGALEFESTYRIKNCYFIHKDNQNIIKRFVKKYGAATMIAYIDSSYFNRSCSAYYYPDSHAINHGVVVVGWDDSYPASNFKSRPDGNGAWLIRNSYKTGGALSDNSINSYFWLSYYDKTINSKVCVMKLQDREDFSEHNYYYDGIYHSNGSFTSSVKNYSCANIYEAKGRNDGGYEKLDTISFTYTSGGDLDEDTEFEVEIYTGLADRKDPTDGHFAYSAKASLPLMGVYSIKLDKPVYVKNGELYSVIVTPYSGKTVAIETDPSETQLKDENKKPSYQMKWITGSLKGQSLYSGNNKVSWIDMADRSFGNFCIGAQTSDYDGVVLYTHAADLYPGGTVTLSVNMLSGASGSFDWSSSDPSVAVVKNGIVTGIAPGEAIITVTDEDGITTDCCNVIVKEGYEDFYRDYNYTIRGDGSVLLSRYNGTVSQLTVPGRMVIDGRYYRTLLSSTCFADSVSLNRIEFKDGVGFDSDIYGVLPRPHNGCYVLGWFDAQEGGKEIFYDTAVKKNGDHTIYSRWVLDDDIRAHVSQNGVSENVTGPTCGRDGSYDEVVYCARCGMELSRINRVIPKTGKHLWDEGVITKVQTEHEKGEMKFVCTVCGQERFEETDTLPAKDSSSSDSSPDAGETSSSSSDRHVDSSSSERSSSSSEKKEDGADSESSSSSTLKDDSSSSEKKGDGAGSESSSSSTLKDDSSSSEKKEEGTGSESSSSSTEKDDSSSSEKKEEGTGSESSSSSTVKNDSSSSEKKGDGAGSESSSSSTEKDDSSSSEKKGEGAGSESSSSSTEKDDSSSSEKKGDGADSESSSSSTEKDDSSSSEKKGEGAGSESSSSSTLKDDSSSSEKDSGGHTGKDTSSSSVKVVHEETGPVTVTIGGKEVRVKVALDYISEVTYTGSTITPETVLLKTDTSDLQRAVAEATGNTADYSSLFITTCKTKNRGDSGEVIITTKIKLDKKQAKTLGLGKEVIKSLKTMVKALNNEMKAGPVKIKVSKADLGRCFERMEASFNSKGRLKVKAVYANLSGNTVKIKKKDFRVVSSDPATGLVVLEGIHNFEGTVTVTGTITGT